MKHFPYYTILKSACSDDLCQQVNRMSGEGWALYGVLVVGLDGALMQGMVKKLPVVEAASVSKGQKR